MIRPQQKTKEIQKPAKLKTGNKVDFAGGIHGRVKEVGDNYFLIEVADGVKIKVEKDRYMQTLRI